MLQHKNGLNQKPLKKEDTQKIQKLEQLLHAEKSLPKLVSSNGEEITLPQPVFEILCNAVEAMANGVEITISPLGRYLTVNEAADLLNVSRECLEKLLNSKEIPYETIGTQNKIVCRDVLEYKSRAKNQQREALRELTSFLQEEGFYDD